MTDIEFPGISRFYRFYHSRCWFIAFSCHLQGAILIPFIKISFQSRLHGIFQTDTFQTSLSDIFSRMCFGIIFNYYIPELQSLNELSQISIIDILSGVVLKFLRTIAAEFFARSAEAFLFLLSFFECAQEYFEKQEAIQ